jgi:hypothetical protein
MEYQRAVFFDTDESVLGSVLCFKDGNHVIRGGVELLHLVFCSLCGAKLTEQNTRKEN